MAEIQQIHKAATPVETLFVIDAMIGQDSVNTAKAFNEALLTGVVLTKVDGDARGGAALSVRQLLENQSNFCVSGKTDALEPFHPERIASRILGMGDVLSLIEDVERKVDKKKAENLLKVAKGKRFDLEDLREQLQQMKQLGGMESMMDKIPGMGNMAQMTQQKDMTGHLVRWNILLIL